MIHIHKWKYEKPEKIVVEIKEYARNFSVTEDSGIIREAGTAQKLHLVQTATCKLCGKVKIDNLSEDFYEEIQK